MGEKERKRFYSNPGSQYADVHRIRIDEQGHKTLVKTGEKTNIYVKICMHQDEVDIDNILRRAETEGYEILDKRAAYSGDLTQAPKSMLEAAIMLNDQEVEFNHLPLDIRKAFNFSFTEYLAEANNNLESWATKMGYVKETNQETTTPETTTPEPIKEGGEN